MLQFLLQFIFSNLKLNTNICWGNNGTKVVLFYGNPYFQIDRNHVGSIFNENMYSGTVIQ